MHSNKLETESIMKALVYHRSVILYLLDGLLSRVRPRRFFPGLVPMSLTEIPFSPPVEDWVVVRNRMCGICGSDLRLLHGSESMLLEPYASFPAVIGHEIVGEVVSAPAGSRWKPKDRVVVEPVLACKQRGLPPCRFCAEGLYNLCENFTSGRLASGVILGYNQSAGGGMAEFCAVDPDRLFAVPDNVPDEIAVLTDSLASALNPVMSNMPRDDHTVIVYGAGILGQHIVRILRALGSTARIIMIARYPFQRDLALAGGADSVLMSPKRAELGEAVGAKLTPTTLGGGNLEGGADFFFDCVGSSGSLQEGLLVLRGRGTYVMVGTAGDIGPVDISSLWFRELRMTGSSCYSIADYQGEEVRIYQKAIDLLSGGKYATDGLLSHTFPLAGYAQAFQTAYDKRRNKCMKVALDMRNGG